MASKERIGSERQTFPTVEQISRFDMYCNVLLKVGKGFEKESARSFTFEKQADGLVGATVFSGAYRERIPGKTFGKRWVLARAALEYEKDGEYVTKGIKLVERKKAKKIVHYGMGKELTSEEMTSFLQKIEGLPVEEGLGDDSRVLPFREYLKERYITTIS